MNKLTDLMTDKLLKNSETKWGLFALEKLFCTAIPFNIPHKFKFLELSQKRVQLQIPAIRYNKNHLGGIHACAIATLGELPAGLSLVKRFGTTQFRLVMQKLNATYIKQSKESLIGEAIIAKSEFEKMELELSRAGVSTIVIISNIFTIRREKVAVIQTTWQIKDWKKVTYSL